MKPVTGLLLIVSIALGNDISGPVVDGHHKARIADWLVTTADDFIVDVYVNGERVGDRQRTLLEERFGATVERIDYPINAGDWVVFNVVNNRLRWGGVRYFAVAGVTHGGRIGFQSELRSGRWSCCDNPSNVSRFISERDFLSTHPARRIEKPWHEGNAFMRTHAPHWSGQPVWGATPNTWIKFVAPDHPPARRKRSA